MRAGRWAGAGALALALAIAPGALRLTPTAGPGPVERPAVVPLGRTSFAALPVPTPGRPVDEVAIVPPGELQGTLAAPATPPATFAPLHLERSEGEVFALVIGIDDYPGRRADLRSAVADADTIDTALDGFDVPAGHRVVLRDGQARRDDVVAAVESLVAQGGPDATLVLAFAGHVRKVGPTTEALVLADGGTITDAELAALLAPASTQPMWILLATCFAGGFTEVLAPGRVLTGAADANSLAYESTRLGGSFLVHYLVREGWLEGAARGPSVQDAFAHAKGVLMRDHPSRVPVQIDQADGPLVLGVAAHRPPPPPPSPDPPPPEAPPQAPPAPPGRPPTTEPEPPAEDPCLLGVLYC